MIGVVILFKTVFLLRNEREFFFFCTEKGNEEIWCNENIVLIETVDTHCIKMVKYK